MSIKQHINCSNLAKVLDVDSRTIRNWAVDSVDPLPAKKIKGIWLFECDSVNKWLDQHGVEIDVKEKLDEILTSLME